MEKTNSRVIYPKTMRVHAWLFFSISFLMPNRCLFAQEKVPTKLSETEINSLLLEAKKMSESTEVIESVKTHNLGLENEYKTLDNKQWKALSPRDFKVSKLTSNNLANFLRTEASPYITEAFVSGLDGKKVAFLAKTSSWNHSGNPKHDDPIKGRTWVGQIELDESSGVNQLQVSVPIKEKNTPIGSLVIGVSIVRYRQAHPL